MLAARLGAWLRNTGEHRSGDNSKKSGNGNCQAAHSTFYRTQFHCLRCTYGMG